MATSITKKNPDGSTTSTSTIPNQLASTNIVKSTNPDGTTKFTQFSTPSSSGGGGGGGSSSIKSSYDPQAYLQQMQGNVNSIYDNQKNAQLAQLKASQNKALGLVNQQKAEVAPQYADKRNQSDVVSNQNVQKLREMMAANGLQSSGENVTANVGLQNARQSALNTLNTQEQQTMNDFNRQITDINDPAQEQSLISNLEFQRAQALLDMGIRADDRSYQVGRDGVADNQWNQQFDYGKSVDNRNFNYQTGRDNVLDNRYNNEFTYQQGRDQVGDKQWQSQFDYGKSVDNRNFDYQVGRDKVGDKQAAEQLALQKAQFKTETDWRKYTYTHMSKSEQVTFDYAKKKDGEDAAWRLYEMNYNGEIAKSQNQANIDGYTNAGFNDAQGGSGNFTKKAQGSPTKTFNSQMSQAVQQGGVPSSWVPALTELVGRESSWNSGAKNPKSTAHGYAQFLNSTESKYEKEMGLDYSNPTHQLIMMAKYVKDRYGTPEKALAFWDKNNWY